MGFGAMKGRRKGASTPPTAPAPALTALEIALLDLTSRLFEDEESKDVTFKLSDGEVRAHRLVLKQLSEVWSRMFATQMAEAYSGVIRVPEVNCVSMRVFMRLLYTAHVCKSDWQGDGGGASSEKASHQPSSSSDDAVPLDVLISVASLAKAYMVQSTLSLVLQTLKGRLEAAKRRGAVSVFERIASGAIKADIGPLRLAALDAARDFATNAEDSDSGSNDAGTGNAVKDKFLAKQFSPEVQFELEAIWPAPANPPRKRARLSRLS